MASTNLPDLATAGVLQTTFSPKISKSFNTKGVLLSWLAQKGRVRESNMANASWRLLYGSSVPVTKFADGQAFGTPNSMGFAGPKLDWAGLDYPVAVGDRARKLALQEGQLESDLLDLAIAQAMGFIARDLNAKLYSGAGGADEVVGLQIALSDTLAYGGVVRAGAVPGAAFRGVVNKNGADRALTMTLMNAVETAVDAAGFALNPSDCAIFMGSSEYNKFRDLVTASNTRYVESGTALESGATSIKWNGIDVIRDSQAPAKSVFFLNSQTIELLYTSALPDGGVRLATLQGSDGSTGLVADIKPYAKTGHFYAADVAVSVQLKVDSPQANAMLTNVDPAL